MDELQHGPTFRFADWPRSGCRGRAAGVYTVWRAAELTYAGMSGRGAQAEDFTADPERPGATMGLWTRLNSHACGHRSGDQFNIYIRDRFIIPVLTRVSIPLRWSGRYRPAERPTPSAARLSSW